MVPRGVVGQHMMQLLAVMLFGLVGMAAWQLVQYKEADNISIQA